MIAAPLVVLSPATTQDAAFLASLWESEPPSFLIPTCRFFVATEAGHLVAAGRLDLRLIGGGAEIDIRVCADRQGGGIDTAVVQKMIEEAAILGCRWLTIDLPEKDTETRTAFSQAGFRVQQIQDDFVTMIHAVPTA